MVYFLRHPHTKYIKIGYSNNITRRQKQLEKLENTDLELLACATGDLKTESKLHREFSKFRKHGEWFSPQKPLLDLINSIENKKLPDRFLKISISVIMKIPEPLEEVFLKTSIQTERRECHLYWILDNISS
jgi:hypothetical protein